jgi:hypothetical protein
MIQYDWGFSSIQVIYDSGSMQNIVNNVRWQLMATYNSGSQNIQKVSSRNIELPAPNPESFIPFVNITKEQMTTWVENTLGNDIVDSIKDQLSSSIAQDLNPTVGIVQAPWIN